MAFSKTKIFNITLNHLGITTVLQNTTLESDSKAIVLNNYYETARDFVLESHEWSFATVEKELSVSTSDSPNPNYQYAFYYPNDCLASRALIAQDRKEKKYELAVDSNGTKLVLTNHNPCQLRYTKRIENESLFTASFVNCLSFYLAYLAAQGLSGSGQKKNTHLQDYNIALRQAVLNDARKITTHDEDDKDYTDIRW